jgi:hypothetical protein
MNTQIRNTLAICFAFCCTLAVAAATITNHTPSTDGDWSNPANWIGDVAPADGDSVVLHIMPGLITPTNIDIADLTLTTLVFSNDVNTVSGLSVNRLVSAT